jgi:hypothetical protein
MAIRGLLAVTLAGAALIGGAPREARASEQVRLTTSLLPDTLGASTTILYSFRVAGADGQLPQPLVLADIRLPAGMGLASSSLGVATCDAATLETDGSSACPSGSHLGYGRAFVEFDSPRGRIGEAARVVALLGASPDGQLLVLFYVEGTEPVQASLVFPGVVRADAAPFGTRLDTSVPLIPVWPEGPDVVLTSFRSTIGPLDLLYYRHRHGRLVPFQPRGLMVPRTCPPGGFPFGGDFGFADGSVVHALTHVACPRTSKARRAGAIAR